MKKQIAYLFSALALPALLTAPVLAAPATQQIQISHRPGFMLKHHGFNKLTGAANVTSTNWSGYAVTGNNGAYNSVSSSWTQPAVDCTGVTSATYSSYWVGLDGYSNSTVEQIGTEADCNRTSPVYSAWYEMYPSNPYEVGVQLAIHAGDQMSASVNYHPAVTTTMRVHGRTRTTTVRANYVLALQNATTGKSFSVTLTPTKTYARSSAEVITEAPYSGGILPLANFGTAPYTTSLVNGKPVGGLPNLQDIIMQNPAGMAATPSPFEPNNEDFSVTWSAS